MHTEESKGTHIQNFVPWHPCLLVTLQMDYMHTKAVTWELEARSPKWIELVTDLLLGYVLLIDLLSSFSCLWGVTAWSDPEVKGPPRKVKWWLVISQLSSRYMQRKVGQRTTNYQKNWSIILAQPYNSPSILGSEILIPHFLDKWCNKSRKWLKWILSQDYDCSSNKKWCKLNSFLLQSTKGSDLDYRSSVQPVQNFAMK